jgi:hypothetical protein
MQALHVVVADERLPARAVDEGARLGTPARRLTTAITCAMAES